MSDIYIFEDDDIEALTNYEEGSDISKDWVSHIDRNGGAIYELQNCLFCNNTIGHFHTERPIEGEHGFGRPILSDFEPHETIYLVVCDQCGWHRCQKHWFFTSPIFPICVATSVVLQKKKVSDPEVPLDELRNYLSRNWSARRELSPGKAEDIVANIFKDHFDGEIHYTTNGVYSPDGGIDFVIAQSSLGIEYAFQVKRRLTDKPECIQNVRAFVGAVAASSYSRGYYVTTTPRFTSSAVREMEERRENLNNHKLNIELIDGSKLFDILKSRACSKPSFESLKNHIEGPESEWVRLIDRDGYPKSYNSLSELLNVECGA